MAREARLVVRLPRGGALERRLRSAPSVAGGDIALNSLVAGEA